MCGVLSKGQHDGEMRKAKSSMSAEVKELAALLQKQGEERLQQADLRLEATPLLVPGLEFGILLWLLYHL